MNKEQLINLRRNLIGALKEIEKIWEGTEWDKEQQKNLDKRKKNVDKKQKLM